MDEQGKVIDAHRAVMKEIGAFWRFGATVKKFKIRRVLREMRMRREALLKVSPRHPTKWDKKRMVGCMKELVDATRGMYWLLDEMVVDWDTYIQPCLLQPFSVWKWRDDRAALKPRQWTYVVWGENTVVDWFYLKQDIVKAREQGKKVVFT